MPFCTRPHVCTFLKEIDMKQSGTELREGKDTVFKPPSNQTFPYQKKVTSVFCFCLVHLCAQVSWFCSSDYGAGSPS